MVVLWCRRYNSSEVLIFIKQTPSEKYSWKNFEIIWLILTVCPFNCLYFYNSFWNPNIVDSSKCICSHFTWLKSMTPNHLDLLKRGISLKYLYVRIGDGNFIFVLFLFSFFLHYHLSRYYLSTHYRSGIKHKQILFHSYSKSWLYIPPLMMKKLSHDFPSLELFPHHDTDMGSVIF